MSNYPEEKVAVDNVLPPVVKRTLVLLAVQRGKTRLTRALVPMTNVVREDGKPPRIEFVVPEGPRAA